MNFLSDATVAHLRRVADWPQLDDGKYQVIERLAQGGMGTVYVAEDTELSRRVALKVLSDPLSDPEAAERMVREARIIAQLEHPAIVPVHDVGRLPDGRIYYVMKLVKGARLDRHFEADASIAARLRVFERICEAVAFAHAHGVIHRDLKPANVMVGEFGEVLVMDWGVAKAGRLDDAATATLAKKTSPAGLPDTMASEAPESSADRPTLTKHTAAGTVIGTPGYMAPEQARGDVEAVGPPSDVYALGALLYFLLARRDPPEWASDHTDFPVPRKFDPAVPKPLQAICLKAMAGAPSARYDRVDDLRREITRFQSGLAVVAYPEGPIERIARWASHYRTPILLVLAYLTMRLLLLVFGGR